MSKKTNELNIYSNLSTRIQLSHADIKVMSILSSNPGDGKTELAYNLAKSYADIGNKVLLVDSNLRYPKLIENMTNGNYKGSDNLQVLSIEEITNDSSTLVDAEALENVFENLKMKYDYIIIDTLSLNAGMDGLILGKISDGVIYIAVENKSKMKDMEELNTLLVEMDIKLIGSIWKESI